MKFLILIIFVHLVANYVHVSDFSECHFDLSGSLKG